LVEAGPDYGARTSGGWPADLVDGRCTPNSHDWGYEQTRARVIGGCSVHNESALVLAQAGDYDRWGVPGWSDAELAPTIDYVAGLVPTRTCGDDGLAAWQRAFLDAAIEQGYGRIESSNDPTRIGVGPFVRNIKDGIRWNSAFSFLDPVRTGITLLAGLVADRFLLDDSRAHSIILCGPEGDRTLRARHFVLCAGVYGSPAILLRTGVGPAKELRRLNIPPRVKLPGVGKNLHDHPGVGAEYEPTPQLVRATNGDVRAGRHYEAEMVLKDMPDLHLVPYQTQGGSSAWTFGIMAYDLDPRSRGRLTLRSRDPNEAPQIELGFLSDPAGHDARVLIDGLQRIHRLTRSGPLAKVIARGPRRFASTRRLLAYVSNNVSGYSHPVGTCRMGPSPAAGDVVNAQGKVYGLQNVFVADASTIPRIPRANTNFTCYVIGARSADFLAKTARPRR
jgi:choline dehydrogenase